MTPLPRYHHFLEALSTMTGPNPTSSRRIDPYWLGVAIKHLLNDPPGQGEAMAMMFLNWYSYTPEPEKKKDRAHKHRLI